MKLYIPTTTLNFNNILSSESISPKAFYSKRDFGYKTWNKIKENNLDNAIILYKNLCNFERPKSDIDDYPMTIEIFVDNSIEQRLKTVSDGVYIADFTIFLDPWNANFIFYSEQEKRIALSKSQSSLETKFVELYEKKMKIEQPRESYQIISINDCTLNEKEIEKDIRINKIKGCLYGYYIGGLLSTTKEYVKKLYILREIYNVSIAIYNNENRRATPYQDSQLDDFCKKLIELKYTKLNNKLSKIIEDEEKTKEAMNCVKQFISKKYCENDLNKKEILFGLSMKDEINAQNPAIESIKNEIAKEEQEIKNDKKSIDIKDRELYIENLKIKDIDSIKDSQRQDLFKAWVNEILSKKEYNKDISIFKDKVLYNIIDYSMNNIYKEQWDNCEDKNFLIDLYNHVVNGSVFNQEWKDDIFSSLAALITNGDDWEKLLRFMQSKEMTDYRFAFAMFGTLDGFANLPRDFTDVLLTEDRDYVAEVYKYFYYQLFNKEISVNNKNSKSKSKIPSERIINKKQIDDKNKPVESIGKNSREKSVNENSKDNKTKSINYSNGNKESKDGFQAELPFTENKCNKLFYEDNDAIKYVQNFIGPKEKEKFESFGKETLKKQEEPYSFSEDLSWFQGEYKKGEDSSYYGKAQKDNTSAIENYCKHLEKVGLDTSKINEIKEELKKIYCKYE